MAETASQTWQRLTGKNWSEAAKGGFTTGTAQQNLALQQKLLGGWNPYAAAATAPAPAAPAQPSGPAPDAMSVFAKQKEEEQRALTNRLNAEQSGLIGEATGILQKGEEMAAPIRGQINTVRDLVRNLNQNITNTTKGYDVSESRRQLMVGNQQADYNNQLAGLATTLNEAANYTEGQYKVAQLKLTGFADRAAREMTGFDSSKETQFNALLDQIQEGRRISDRDWQLAQDLAKEEREFTRQKALMDKEYQQQLALKRASGSGTGAISLPTATPTSKPTTRPTTSSTSGSSLGSFNSGQDQQIQALMQRGMSFQQAAAMVMGLAAG